MGQFLRLPVAVAVGVEQGALALPDLQLLVTEVILAHRGQKALRVLLLVLDLMVP